MNSKSKHRILYVNHSMGIGGIEKMILEFANYFCSRGHIVSVAVFAPGGSFEKELQNMGVDVYNLEKKEGIDIGLVKRLVSLIKDLSIDIVHTNNYSSWLYVVIASLFCRINRLVHTEHSNVKEEKRRRYLAERFLAYFSNAVVAVSEQVKSKMVSKSGMSDARVRVIPNGISTTDFSRSPERRGPIRSELGLQDEDILIGTVGRLVPVKDHFTLLEAFAQVRKRLLNVRLIIVGDGPLKSDLLTLVSKLKLENEVTLSGERRDIPEILSAMDIYVVSSISEGMSLSILEAMSTRLPIVATAVGGNNEVIDDQVNGFLVPAQNSNVLAEHIHKLVVDREQRILMGIKSQERAQKSFDHKIMMQKYASLYGFEE